jgi:FAD/FMN-containing dehydrogenase
VGNKNYMNFLEHLINYSYDGFMTEAKPDAVLLPVNTEQIFSIMRISCRKGIPGTLRRAGTNLGGGSIPLFYRSRV